MRPKKLKFRGPFARWFWAVDGLRDLSESWDLDGRDRDRYEQTFHDVMAQAEKEMTGPQQTSLHLAFYYLTQELNKE